MIFESHAHYEDAMFDKDRFEVLDALFAQGAVHKVLNCCSDMAVVPTVLKLANTYSNVYASVGVHPNWCDEAAEGYLDELREAAKNKKVVAIGEIGLDYFCDKPKEMQQRVFEQQLELAAELNLPVIIHSRLAGEQVVKTLAKYKPRGVVHRFGGTPQELEAVLALGMYVSFNCDLTYPEYSEAPLYALMNTPFERLLIETDCPYAPPKRIEGARSTSEHLRDVIAFIAKARGVSEHFIEQQSCTNACRLYGI